MQVIALHIADQQSIEIKLMQVAAGVVQVIEMLARRQGQGGQVAERILFVGKRTLRCGPLNQSAQQVVGEFQLLCADAEVLPITLSKRSIDSKQSR